jgi:hypothetical protein
MIDEDISKKLIAQLENHEKRISALEGTPIKKDVVKKMSLKEFLLEKKPTDQVKTTLAIGYFLEHYEGMESFNAKDLANAFRSAKEPPPKNINDKVNMNIHNGQMMEAIEKKDNIKAWVLTATGEKQVEEGFRNE